MIDFRCTEYVKVYHKAYFKGFCMQFKGVSFIVEN